MRIAYARRVALVATLAILTGGLSACAPTEHRAPARPGVLFDDFAYTSSSDRTLREHGWTVRAGSGGPGESGGSWTPDGVSFPTVDGASVLRLTMATDGTAEGTTQSEVSRTREEGIEGSYLARIRFTDEPVSGPDGDRLVQTFFAISSTPECDPTYSELDFSEYLPNGGYEENRTFNSQTTWRTTGDGCDDSRESDQFASLAGWHTVFATVGGGHVRYYIDGDLVGRASGRFYPRRAMAIDLNHWLLDRTAHQGDETSTWVEDVDYVFWAEDRILSPREALQQVERRRRAGTTFVDTVS